MGAILIVLTVCMLTLDWAPWYPFLLAFFLFVGILATVEMLHLLEDPLRPPRWLALGGFLAVVAANWVPHLVPNLDVWRTLALTFAGFVLVVFLREMAV